MFALSFTTPYSLNLRGDETKVKWVPPKKKSFEGKKPGNDIGFFELHRNHC